MSHLSALMEVREKLKTMADEIDHAISEVSRDQEEARQKLATTIANSNPARKRLINEMIDLIGTGGLSKYDVYNLTSTAIEI